MAPIVEKEAASTALAECIPGKFLAADIVVQSLDRLDSDAFERLLQESSLVNKK
jgi:hypothetical protein